MSGWIKLHRKFLDWEWYSDPYMVHIFLYFLIEANHEPKRWRGIQVNRGQLITGRHSLSEKLGMSERRIRTCIERLKSTNEVTIQTTNRYSIITICKYDIYQVNEKINDQQSDQLNDQQKTNNRPTKDQQSTTTKNIRNKEDKNLRSKEPTNSNDTQKAYRDCNEAYFEFYKGLTGLPPKFDGQEGKALKSIITYISGLEQIKSGGRTILETFKFILEHHARWDAFHQKQLKLSQINSNLTNIINSIKNGVPRKDATKAENERIGNLIRSGVFVDFSPKDPSGTSR